MSGLLTGGSGSGAYLSVVDFGAKGDWNPTTNTGTDDRAAFTAAFAYLASSGGGGALVIPPGNWRVSKYALLQDAQGVSITGPGARIYFGSDDVASVSDGIALSNNTARSAFYVLNSANVTIRDLTFIGADSTNVTSTNVGCAVYARYSQNLILSDVVAQAGYSLLYQDATSNTTGVGDSTTVASGIVTLTDAGALFRASNVGTRIVISGSTNRVNDGSFVVLSYISATQITYANPAAIAETSSFTFTLSDADTGTKVTNCRSINQRGPLIPSSNCQITGCEFLRPLTVDICGIGDRFDKSGSIITLTDAPGRFDPSYHGKIVTIAGATTAGNNGLFRITYISPSQISWTNASGATEIFADPTTTWWIANGEKAGVGAGSAGALAASAGNVTLTASESAFSASDVGKIIRIAYANNAANQSAFVITAYNSPTSVTWENVSGVTEAFYGVWSVDSFDRTAYAGDTYGSTHGVYAFAGRTNVTVDRCIFKGIRTTCVKWSGTSLPLRGIAVTNCYAENAGNFFTGGADDAQEHTGVLIQGNTIINASLNSVGRGDGLGISILGAKDVIIRDNTFHWTYNAIGSVDGRGYSGNFAIAATGGTQSLEDLIIDNNKFTMDDSSMYVSAAVPVAIKVTNAGARGKWGATGTLTKSGNTMTLTDSNNLFTTRDIGKPIHIHAAPNAGNIGYFTVTSVPSLTTCTFENAAGVGGAVSAGTWRMSLGFNAAFNRGFSGGVKISNNMFGNLGGVSIYTTSCVGPEIVGNYLSLGGIYMEGDVTPHVYNNRYGAALGGSIAIIRIFDGTSWPIIHDNFIVDTRLGPSTSNGMAVGDSGGAIRDWPLLGKKGRAVPTQAHEEVVVAYGSAHVDGDYLDVNGAIFTYKAVSPGANDFNSFTDLKTKINALSGYSCVDYGSVFADAVVTQHLKITRDALGATPDGFIQCSAWSLFPTALVARYNSTATVFKSRGAGSAGPVADKTVIWSPCCAFDGGAIIWADNDSAQTLLQAGGWRTVKDYLDGGANEVIKHGTSAGTEEFRWAIL